MIIFRLFKSLIVDPRDKFQRNVRQATIDLEKNHHRIRAIFVAIIFQDLPQVVKLTFFTLRGMGSTLRPYGVNPKNLKDFDPKASPTLFIHGSAHNHGVFIPMIKYLNQAIKKRGPFFTMNYPVGASDEAAIELIGKKIEEINQLYRNQGLEPPPINLIGYSNGGDIEVQYVLQNSDHLEKFGKIITIGQPISRKEKEKFESLGFDRIFDIVGTYDGFLNNGAAPFQRIKKQPYC